MDVLFNNGTNGSDPRETWIESNTGVVNKTLLLSIVSTPPSSGSGSGGGGPSTRDFYLGIRFIILICVFVSVYLIIWLAQRQLTKAFEKSHESQSGQQRNRNLLCPLLFLLPMTTAGGRPTGGNNLGIHPYCGRRRCPCPQMASYDVRNYIGWNSSAINYDWASRNIAVGCGDTDSRGSDQQQQQDDFGAGIAEGCSPPKYEDILLLSQQREGSTSGDSTSLCPPSYEDAKKLLRGEEDSSTPLNAYLV